MSENEQVEAYLRVEAVEAIYDVSILALRGVTFGVAEGSVTALLGANGAGKTTTLRAISNLLGAGRGAVHRGRIMWRGRNITTTHPAALVKQGLVQVLEGRQCFAHLTVEENSAFRLLCAPAVTERPARGTRAHLHLVPALEGTPANPRRAHLGRRATDGGAGPCLHDGTDICFAG